MNKANLLKLAQGLMAPLVCRFDMRTYSEGEVVEETKCGTAGCAIGHATNIVEPKWIGEDYNEYSIRLFGIGEDAMRLEFDNNWCWCFSDAWRHLDNTPQGAAKRITYLVKHGGPPEWFSAKQMQDIRRQVTDKTAEFKKLYTGWKQGQRTKK